MKVAVEASVQGREPAALNSVCVAIQVCIFFWFLF